MPTLDRDRQDGEQAAREDREPGGSGTHLYVIERADMPDDFAELAHWLRAFAAGRNEYTLVYLSQLALQHIYNSYPPGLSANDGTCIYVGQLLTTAKLIEKHLIEGVKKCLAP